jgi:hypothetical protein
MDWSAGTAGYAERSLAPASSDRFSFNEDGARRIMTFGYAQPFSFRLGAQSQLTVAGVRHGVTEITLSDGRRIRAMLHVTGINPSTKQPGTFDILYDIVTEVVNRPDVTILDVHETLQWDAANGEFAEPGDSKAGQAPVPRMTVRAKKKRARRRDLQQDAYQPAGNGTNGHAIWLSLAARGAFLTYQAARISISCGAGPTASPTSSSNRSNSNSLIGVLRGLTGTVSKGFCLRVELIAKIVSIEPRNPPWLAIPSDHPSNLLVRNERHCETTHTHSPIPQFFSRRLQVWRSENGQSEARRWP